MRFLRVGILVWIAVVAGARVAAQSQSPSSPSSSSSKHPKGSSSREAQDKDIDDGTVVNGVYRNKALALSCKIPDGWILRTEEMNTREDEKDDKASPQGSAEGGRVLLAAFSRPPDARGEDINSSILIAVEKVSAYPGMTEAAQYFGPLAEVVKAQGFEADEDPYEFAVGTKKVVRGDFHKDVGSRVMRQSTLAFFARGYAVSITVIGGTEEDVEELVDGVSFAGK